MLHVRGERHQIGWPVRVPRPGRARPSTCKIVSYCCALKKAFSMRYAVDAVSLPGWSKEPSGKTPAGSSYSGMSGYLGNVGEAAAPEGLPGGVCWTSPCGVYGVGGTWGPAFGTAASSPRAWGLMSSLRARGGGTSALDVAGP